MISSSSSSIKIHWWEKYFNTFIQLFIKWIERWQVENMYIWHNKQNEIKLEKGGWNTHLFQYIYLKIIHKSSACRINQNKMYLIVGVLPLCGDGHHRKEFRDRIQILVLLGYKLSGFYCCWELQYTQPSQIEQGIA